VWLDYRFGGTRTSSEQFNCAGRTILTGLIAVDIVSHWYAASCGCPSVPCNSYIELMNLLPCFRQLLAT
jgi:hypothetical protein